MLPTQLHRKLNRKRGFDYRSSGYYFVTICTQDRQHFFGDISDQKMQLSECGKIAQQCWIQIPNHFPSCVLYEFVVMPDHIHGVLEIAGNEKCEGNKNFCSLSDIPWQTKWAKSLSSIIRGYKIGVTKFAREHIDQNFGWQKSFHDHIIRDEESFHSIQRYILENPLRWGNKDVSLYDIGKKSHPEIYLKSGDPGSGPGGQIHHL